MRTISRIPLVDLKAQYQSLKEKINQSLLDIINEASFVQGPAVKAFEGAFAQYSGASHCIGLNSGTDALFLIMKALGVKEGDEIITVPFTFFATAEAIVHAGGTVKFVDLEPERHTLDPAKLEQALSPRTVGIIPVHLFGMPADMDPILAFAQKHKLWVLEDACQAHGALYKGRKAGTLGNASAFSFYPSKNLGAYGDGGAVITNDGALAEKLRMLRDHGQKSRYHSEIVGYNSRLDGLQAAVLQVKLPYLDEWNEKRRKVASWYGEALKGVQEVTCPGSFDDSVPVFHLYVIQTEKRDALASFLESQGISTAVHYGIPLHRQTPFKEAKHPPLPVCEALAAKVLSLPMYPELSREQVEFVGEKIRAFFAK